MTQTSDQALAMSVNPYEPSAYEAPPPTFPDTGLLKWGFAIGVGYPIFLLGALHLFWGLTWLSLGFPPRPYRDGADFFGANALMYTIGIAFVASPVLSIVTVGFEIVHGAIRRLSVILRFSRVGLIVVCWAGAFVYIRWDPLRIVDWYMD